MTSAPAAPGAAPASAAPSNAPPQGAAQGVLVVGGARRIGARIAEALAASGRPTAVHFHSSRAEAEALAAALGGGAAALRADLEDEAETRALLPAAARALGGPPRLVVVSASMLLPDRAAGPRALERHLAVNVRAPWILARAAARAGTGAAPARVVLVCDADPGSGGPGVSAYAASAAARAALVPLLDEALSPRARVLGVALGPTLRGARESEAHFRALVARAGRRAPVGAEAAAAAVLAAAEGRAAPGAVAPVGGPRPRPGAAVLARGLEAEARVGWGEDERARPQRLLISFRAEVDGAGAGGAADEGDLASVVDYGALADALRGEVEAGAPRRLLETLAAALAARAFAFDPRVRAIHLRIEKPAVRADARALGIERLFERPRGGGAGGAGGGG